MQKYHELIKIQKCINDFFREKGFDSILTPPIVENPGMETHIHPFQIYSAHKKKTLPLYLHTSPEFHMKELLSHGYEKIYTMSYSFRDEPNSETHRKQFLMLEWYRANARYEEIMNDTEDLIQLCSEELSNKKIKLKRVTVNQLFKEFLQFEILDFLDKEALYQKIKDDFKNIYLGDLKDYQWDDLYFLLFLNLIEPKLKDYGNILLYEFPFHLSALSTIKKEDPRVCERFEVYLDGLEICNCFNELTALDEQKERFIYQAKLKEELYSYNLPAPNVLYESLERGIKNSAGIALGVERLLMSLTGQKDIFFDSTH